MSLQVWLPLNGDLQNQGLNNMAFENYDNNAIIDNNGKIGKCYYLQAATDTFIRSTSTQIFPNTVSIAGWVKIPSQDTPTGGYLFGLTHAANADFMLNLQNTNNIRIYSGNNTLFLTSSITLSRDTWNHIVATSDGTTIKLYINGVEDEDAREQKAININIINSYVTISGRRNGNSTSCSSPKECYINDLRVYDHCLSAKEVEELAKGLVLHYKLDNNGLGNENLTENTGTKITLQPTGTNTYFPPNQINQTAHGIEVVHNSTTSDKFTVSFDYTIINVDTACNLTVSLNYTSAAHSQLVNAVYKGNSIPVGNSSGHLVCTGNLSTNHISNGNKWLIGNITSNNRNVQITISNFKFEKSAIPTPWCPAPGESDYPSIFNSIIYDCSGYRNNGTVVGNLTAAAGSPRYGVATSTIDGAANYIKGITLPNTCQTVSIWVKANKNSTQTIFIDPINDIELAFVGSGNIGVRSSTSDNLFSSDNFINDTWNHLVLIKNNDNSKQVYINGQSEDQLTNTGYIYQGGNIFYLLRRVYSGSSNQCGLVGEISDFRLYVTPFTSAQVLELYNTSGSIDASGNVYTRELVEL